MTCSICGRSDGGHSAACSHLTPLVKIAIEGPIWEFYAAIARATNRNGEDVINRVLNSHMGSMTP